MKNKKIIIAGGSGLIGRALVKSLKAENEIVILSRGIQNIDSDKNISWLNWNGKDCGDWCHQLEHSDVLINLSGMSISNKWTKENKQKIEDSRVEPTLCLGKALSSLENPPALWINGSAVGYYGDRGTEYLDESSALGDGFLSDVCQKWESAFYKYELPKVRRVALRTSMVLSTDGGAYILMNQLAKLFIAGTLGFKVRYYSFIHIDDLVSLIKWIQSSDVDGAINGVVPNPTTNHHFMSLLRKSLNRPYVPPLPDFLVPFFSLILNNELSVAMMSQRVVPKKALDNGFYFKFPDAETALNNLALSLNSSKK